MHIIEEPITRRPTRRGTAPVDGPDQPPGPQRTSCSAKDRARIDLDKFKEGEGRIGVNWERVPPEFEKERAESRPKPLPGVPFAAGPSVRRLTSPQTFFAVRQYMSETDRDQVRSPKPSTEMPDLTT